MARKNKETFPSKHDYSKNPVNRTKNSRPIVSSPGKTEKKSKKIRKKRIFADFEYPAGIRLTLDLVFFVLLYFLWGVLLTDFTYILQKSDLFIWYWPYCRDILFKLGGPLELFTLFITQFFYYPVLSGLILAIGLLVLQKLTVQCFHLSGRLYPISYLPAVLVSLFFVSMNYHIFELITPSKLFVWLPGLCGSFLMKIFYGKLAPSKNRWVPVGILCVLAYPLIGSFALIGSLLCIIEECSLNDKTSLKNNQRQADQQDNDTSPLNTIGQKNSSALINNSVSINFNDSVKQNNNTKSIVFTQKNKNSSQNASENFLKNDSETIKESDSLPLPAANENEEENRRLFNEQRKLNIEIMILIPLAVPIFFYFLCFRQLPFYYFYVNKIIIPIMTSKNFLPTFLGSYCWIIVIGASLVLLAVLEINKRRKMNLDLFVRQDFSWNKKNFARLFAGLVLIFSSAFFIPWNPDFYALLSMQKMLERNDWDGLIRAEARCLNPPRQAIMLRFLALYEKKELGENLFKRSQYAEEHNLLVKMSSVRIYGSEFLLRMGIPNFAAKMATNCLVTVNRSGQSFQILGRSAMVMKEYALARRYFFALDHSLFYKSKFKPYLDYIRQEEIKIENENASKNGRPLLTPSFTQEELAGIEMVEKEMQILRARHQKKDILTNVTYPEMLTYDVYRQNDFESASMNDQELMLSIWLIIRNSEMFIKNFDSWQSKRGTRQIPRHFQEALMVFSYTRKDLPKDKYQFDPLLFEQFTEFMKNQTVTKLSSNKTEYERVRKIYESTYWYYFMEVTEMPFY